MGNFTISNYIGILALIAQGITFALTYFAGAIPPEVALILHGVLAFIQAVTGRITGSPSK